MCGIFGSITQKRLAKNLTDRCDGLLRHRGPDSSGRIDRDLGDGGHLLLMHRRLSIIDLSEAASQPMSFGEGRLWITYNGEVYNYRELRSELIQKGYKFSTESDTEVVLASYDAWGEECVTRFNGDWGLCIFDEASKRLFLSRDRLGVKPLYFHLSDGHFAFSSEPGQLLLMPFVSRELDMEIVHAGVLLNQSDFCERTSYRDIRQLEPGTNAVYEIQTGRLNVVRYWDPAVVPDRGRFQSSELSRYARQIRDLLEDSIRLRLRADVPVGSCLSGGLDSSAIVGLMSLILKRNLPDASSLGNVQKTFTAAYPGTPIDEEQWARKVIVSAGADGHFVFPTAEEFNADLTDLIETHAEPIVSTSIYSQYRVMKLASSHVKVVLDGQGSDELFGGYRPMGPASLRRHVELLRAKIFSWMPRLLRNEVLRISCAAAMGVVREITGRDVNVDFLVHILDMKGRGLPNTLLHRETTRYNLPRLLRYEDRNSMRFGIEARVPFTDYRFVEAVLQMPSCFKHYDGWTKLVLRHAVADVLPADVVWRKDKIGFATPEREWLAGCPEFFTLLARLGVPRYNGSPFWWRLFNLSKLAEPRDALLQ